MSNSQKEPRKFKNLLALIPFFKPYKKEVIFALLALLITSLMVLFFGKAIKYMIDYGFAKENQLYLNLSLAAFGAAVIIMAVAGYYRSSLINAVAEKAIADLRKKVYNHIIRVSAEFFEITKAGDVVSRLTVDTVVLYDIMSSTISFLLRNSLFFIGGLSLLFFTSVKLSLVTMLIIPMAIAPILILGKKIKALSAKSQAALADVGSHIEESVNGIKTVQAYLCENKESRNFCAVVDGSLKASLEKIRLKALMISLVIAFAFSGIAIVLWVGGHDVLSGAMTSGDLSSFIFYSIITATSLVSLGQISGQLQTASAATGRVLGLLDIKSPVQESATPSPLENSKEIAINFQDVGFSYPGRQDFSVLNGFDLTINSGEKVAIVGSSGSGKSTILQLLLRFYDVNSGKITLNNCDIKDLSFADLRQNFSYISQDCFIFSDSIFANIAYADESITESQVEQIIAKNPALDFINQLPNKMHHFVGEKGIKLSGGERQRIAIARAIVKNSPILLLDEATSALDNQNEQIINEAITHLAENKTVITVAHKLATVISADKIIFIKDGQISESGSHQELMDLGGNYKKMYESES